MLEVPAMIDFLMLRLKTALPEPWMEVMPTLRRCVVAGSVVFTDLRAVIRELLSVWGSIREFVGYTGPRNAKSACDKVITTRIVCFVLSVSSFILAGWEIVDDWSAGWVLQFCFRCEGQTA